MYILIAMHPYELSDVDVVTGPFDTVKEAEETRDHIIANNAHPDITWFVCPVVSRSEALEMLGDPEDE